MSVRFKHALWTLVPVIVLALPALSQAAAEPRYTYVEGGWVHADLDNVNEDGDGWAVGGSYAFHPNFHAIAEYEDIDLGGNLDASALAIGIGGNLTLRPGLDGIGRVRWIHEEVDTGNGGNDDDGYGLEAGLRLMINPQLELDGSINYVDVGDSDDTALAIGALYEVAQSLALGGDFSFSDDVTSFFLKARFYFGAPRQMR